MIKHPAMPNGIAKFPASTETYRIQPQRLENGQ